MPYYFRESIHKLKEEHQLIVSMAAMICSIVLWTAPSFAAPVPPAPEASPDVYKTLAENDQFRVMVATWQPGQEDNFHHHPAGHVTLIETDCKLRLTKPDGTLRDVNLKAGTAKARTGKPVKSHKAKNIGDKVCILRFVELK